MFVVITVEVTTWFLKIFYSGKDQAFKDQIFYSFQVKKNL